MCHASSPTRIDSPWSSCVSHLCENCWHGLQSLAPVNLATPPVVLQREINRYVTEHAKNQNHNVSLSKAHHPRIMLKGALYNEDQQCGVSLSKAHHLHICTICDRCQHRVWPVSVSVCWSCQQNRTPYQTMLRNFWMMVYEWGKFQHVHITYWDKQTWTVWNSFSTNMCTLWTYIVPPLWPILSPHLIRQAMQDGQFKIRTCHKTTYEYHNASHQACSQCYVRVDYTPDLTLPLTQCSRSEPSVVTCFPFQVNKCATDISRSEVINFNPLITSIA